VFGAFFAWLKAGEILSTREIWGAILIVAGMVISEIGSAIKPSERFFAFLSDMF
jgi:drug/metabolite transporter (DMT)-like permease